MTIIIQGFDSTEIIDVNTGFISRKRNGEMFVNGSNGWVCTGAVILNNFGYVVERLSLKEFYRKIKNNKASLYCKNGEPKFRVCDIDHGTRRVWSNPTIKHYNIHCQ